MKDRILEFLRTENKTSSQFAEEIGVQASSVSHIVSGRNRPSLDFIIKMLQRYDDLSTDWLIFGKGDMFKIDTASDLFSGTLGNGSENNTDTDKQYIAQSTNIESGKGAEIIKTESPDQEKQGIQKIILVYSDSTFKELKPS